MAQGELVPDEVVHAMLEENLGKLDPKSGILLDGFPRTMEQAKSLQTIFEASGRTLDAVVFVNVTDAEIKRRLTGRLICRDCLRPFHKTQAPFGECPEGRCQGEHLFQRTDDTPELVQIRLRVFRRMIEPVLEHYQRLERLVVVDGEGPVDGVAERLYKVFSAAQSGCIEHATLLELGRLQKAVDFQPRLGATKPGLTQSMDWVIMGPPGSGKGTHAELLTEKFHLRHISSGDLFREHLNGQTELGKLAKGYMDRGDLLPDEITDAMIGARLGLPDTSEGFVLDGYPRTKHQAMALHDMLSDMHRELSGVINISVRDEKLIERLALRRVCRQCQSSFHLEHKPPAKAGVCDVCGGALYHRDDDNPATIRARLKVYHAQTEPLIEFYRSEGLLREVNGESSLSCVKEAVIQAVTGMASGQRLKLRKFRAAAASSSTDGVR